MRFFTKIKNKLTGVLEIPIKYKDNEQTRLAKIKQGDWIDLVAVKDYVYKAGDFVLIDFGVAMQLPPRYEAYVAPRGSCFKNYGLIQTNSPGVVDNSYRGDNDFWFAPMYALRDGMIKKGDRTNQFRIQKKMPVCQFIEKPVFNEKDRGGHGSTGK